MREAIAASEARVNEFTVAPQVNPPDEELPYHEWFVEFDQKPDDMPAFIRDLDESLQAQNSYYYDLIVGNILQRLKISEVRTGGFQAYMKEMGKLGGQNKVQRLANDRKVADRLSKYRIS